MDLVKLAIVQFLTHLGIQIMPEGFFMRHRRIATIVFFMVLMALVASLFTGCASIDAPLNQQVYYLNDIGLTINGRAFNGVALPDKADKYDIQINMKEDIDQLVISTCKRTVIIQSPKDESGGWFKKKRGYTYTYVPGNMELDPGCSMAIFGEIVKQGRVAFGRVFFHDSKLTMKAGVSCNADPDYGATGDAVCQAMQGQKMKIWFTQKALMDDSKILSKDNKSPCAVKPSSDGITWIIDLPNRECLLKFYGVQAPHEEFLLYTIGAEQAPIRGE